MISGIMLLRFLLAHGGKEEDRSLEVGRPAPVGHGDVGVVVGPVGRRRNAPLVAELQGLDAANDLVHVPSDAGGVVETQHQLVLGVDDEDRADGEGQILLVGRARVDHAVGGGDGAVLVANDGEFDVNLILAVSHDIVEPILYM